MAELSGDYKIEVSPNDPSSTSGAYSIEVSKIADWQNAAQSDRDTVTAHKLVQEAGRHRNEGKAESTRKALDELQQALPLWRSINDSAGEATTLNDLGFTHIRNNQAEEAPKYYLQALEIWQRLGNRRNEAELLTNLGVGYYRLGETRKGVEYVEQALKASREIGDRPHIALALNALGTLYDTLYERQRSMECYQEAAQIYHALDNPRWEASALDNIGLSYALIGESQKALENLYKALSLRRSVKDLRGEAYTLQHIGYAFEYLGEIEKSRDYYTQALSLYRTVGDPGQVSYSLIKLGLLSQRADELTSALDYYDQALPFARQARNKNLEGQILSGLGVVYINLGKIDEALKYLDQGLAIQQQIGEKQGKAYSIFNIGECHKIHGDLSKALEQYQSALEINREIGNRSGEAMALFRIAEIERDRGDLTGSRKRIESALEIIEATRKKVIANELRTSYFARSQTYYEFYIALLVQMYRQDGKREHIAEALHANERSRARSLLDSLTEAGASIQKGAPPELLERERRLRQSLNSKTEQHTKLLIGRHTDAQLAAVVKEIESLTVDYDQVLSEIRRSSPRYAALTQPHPLAVEEIQTQVLDKNTLLLEYALGEKESYLWVVTSTSVDVFGLPARKEIEELARRAYGLLTARRQKVKFETDQQRIKRITKADSNYLKVLASLSRVILEPAAALMNKSRLLIVADGTLQYLPFASLPCPGRPASRSRSATLPLVSRYEIVNLPSASTLAVLRREVVGRKPAPKTVAVLADPVFDKADDRLRRNGPHSIDSKNSLRDGDKSGNESELSRALGDLDTSKSEFKIPRLPFTREEADAIARLVPPPESKQATGFEANKATALSPELRQYRIVHFATHGFMNTAHPYLSGIVLSLYDEKGVARDGFLMAHEIYNLNLPVDLAVLSGCRTGLGKIVRGEGILALTRSFMYAGAARVMVSLWDIDDESTAELMSRFYSAMLGKQCLSPSAALRSAQLSLLKNKRWNAPYFWAGFVLQGEPN